MSPRARSSRAGQLYADRLSVLAKTTASFTYERAAAASARTILANCEDTTNTNITLTVREVRRAARLHRS
jgi:hypothetical protein